MRKSFKKAAVRPWFAESHNRAHPRATRRTPQKLEDCHHVDRHYQLYGSYPKLINAFLPVNEAFLIAARAHAACRVPIGPPPCRPCAAFTENYCDTSLAHAADSSRNSPQGQLPRSPNRVGGGKALPGRPGLSARSPRGRVLRAIGERPAARAGGTAKCSADEVEL